MTRKERAKRRYDKRIADTRKLSKVKEIKMISKENEHKETRKRCLGNKHSFAWRLDVY
jgi:hypothetical protein